MYACRSSDLETDITTESITEPLHVVLFARDHLTAVNTDLPIGNGMHSLEPAVSLERVLVDESTPSKHL